MGSAASMALSAAHGGTEVAGLPHVVRLELAGLALYVVLTRAHGGVRSFGRGSLIAKKV